VSYVAPVEEEWAHPVPESERSSALVRFLRIVVAVRMALRTASAVVLTRLWPTLSALSLQTAGAIRAFTQGRALPRLHGFVRSTLAKAQARPRRTTTAPVAQRMPDQEGRGIVRLAIISVLAVCAIALGVYALAPAGDAQTVPLHRKIARPKRGSEPAAPATQQSEPAATSAQPPASTLPSTGTVNAAYASAMAGEVVAVPGVPAAGTVPAASPYAVDVRDPRHSAPSKKPAVTNAVTNATTHATTHATTQPTTAPIVKGASFGAKHVPNAQRFTLRMSGPVGALQGSSDRTGFTVIVAGALSLDKAGPIAASHKSVARAMVLNKGDRSELTIRFVDGKSPAFRVTGRGAELELLIAQ
jgi:hypothetical protein